MTNTAGKEDALEVILLVHIHDATVEVGRRAFRLMRSVSVGRDPYSDLHLDDPTVSRLHALIERKGDGFLIRDCSSNGMAVNGRAVTSHPLLKRDEVSIGRFRLVFEIYGEGRQPTDEQARAEGWTFEDGRTLRAPTPGWQGSENPESD